MRLTRVLPLLALPAILLAGCADSSEETGAVGPGIVAGTSDGGGDEGADSAQDAQDAGTDSDLEAGAGGAMAPLTLTTAEGTTTLTLTEVYCSGEPGDIRHLIGKTGQQPPLVELTPGEFTMVKLDQGRPYTSTAPEGVTLTQDGVEFSGTTLGDATLDGTMTCTRWED